MNVGILIYTIGHSKITKKTVSYPKIFKIIGVLKYSKGTLKYLKGTVTLKYLYYCGSVNHFINRLQASSVLKFTSEPMVNNRCNFLDVGFSVNGDGFVKMSVFINPTDHGTCTNF